MLLTLKQPVQHSFHKSFHDYSPPTPPATSRFSPTVASSGSFLPPSLPASSAPPQSMSTPHRGLPPPAAMNLPPPTQQTPQMGQPLPLNQPMGQLPAPPLQWQGAEESMRNWLHAKAEEEKRKQEEEKTKQENLRLEQRKVEQEMLRTSLNGGIPPYMVPMIFAGMGGGNLPNASLEWAQHYVNQAYQQQQQQQQQQHQHQQQQQQQQQAGQPSPEHRRDSRAPAPPYATPNPSAPPILSTPAASSSTSGPPSAGFPGYQMSPRPRQPSATLPVSRVSQSGPLPRLNTEEANIQQAQHQPALPVMQVPGQPAHPLQQSQTVHPPQQQDPQPSPSIYFHHWQPPTTQAPPSTNTTQPISPDTITSPRKRKATGPQQAAPAPTAQYTSPPFSQGGSSITTTPTNRRRAHSRQRSDVSTGRGQESYVGFGSRHRHTESGMSTQSGGSVSMLPSQQPTYGGPLSAPQEGISSMQSVLSFSQSQQQSRYSQEQRYDTRQHSQGEQQRRYSAGPTDTRLEEQQQQRRTTPPDRDESQRPPPPPKETTQPPR